MTRFRVDVPFEEFDAEHPVGRRHVAPFEIEAASWMEALEEAIRLFQADNVEEYHSWVCKVLHDHVEVTELGSGARFRVQDRPSVAIAEVAVLPGAEILPPPSPLPHAELLAFLGSGRDLKAAAGPVLELVMSALGAEAGSVLLLDPARADLYFLEARGEKADAVKQFRVELGVGIAGWCALRGESLSVFDAPAHPRFQAWISEAIGFDTRSVVCAPIRDAGKTLGVLEVLNVASERIRPAEVTFLEGCARVLALLAR